MPGYCTIRNKKNFHGLKHPFSKMMNSIVRSALRVSTIRSFTPLGRRDFARTFWHMSKREVVPGTSAITLKKPSLVCNCGCGSHHIHTKGNLNVSSGNYSHNNYSNITKQLNHFRWVLRATVPLGSIIKLILII